MADERPSPQFTRRAWLLGVTAGIATLGGCSMDTSEAPAVGNREPGDGTTRSTRRTTTTTPTTDTETTHSRSPRSDAEIHSSYDTTEVRVLSPDGELLGAVTAAVADSPDLRYTGLSETDALPEDRGMLFVYESVGQRSFVMRDMDFGLDIVFADADGTITELFHAPAPEEADGTEGVYDGRGQYVLEVNLEWTTERGVTEGDRLAFELPTSATHR